MGIVLIRYELYPYLDGAKTPINSFSEQSIIYAKNNIEKYNPTNNLQIDIPIWLISTIILHNLKNNFLIRKFVGNYSKLIFESYFLKDFYNKEVREAVLYHFGVTDSSTVSIKTFHRDWMKIKMNDYLEIQQYVYDNKNFELVNTDLDKGFVNMEVKRFVYLCRLAVEYLLYDKIKNRMKDYLENEIINRCVNDLKETGKYPEYIKPKNTGIPQTIKELITKAYETHHLTHPERLKVGIAMQAQGYDIEEIVDIFRQCSDFSDKVTRYQLGSLKRYVKPQ